MDLLETGGFDRRLCEKLCAIGAVQTFAPDSYLFLQEDTYDHVFVLLGGQVQAFKFTANGKVRIFWRLGAGEVVGETAMFDGEQSLCSIQCVTEVKAIRIDNQSFLDLVAGDREVLQWLLWCAARKTRRILKQSVDVYSSVFQRLARLFLDGYYYGLYAKTGEYDKIHLTQTEIASIVGTSRQRVCKGIDFLVKSGFIEAGSNYFQVIDEKGLLEFFQNCS